VTERLAPQPWMISAAARRVMAALEAERPESARFVGGCVRNVLLGAPVADIDIATQLTPEVVGRAARAAGLAVHPTGIEHGTLTLVADGQPFEVTTLRRDVATDGRRATVTFTQDWAEDARRRDFRINALYAAPDGEVFDPTGGGLDDVRARRVVFVGDPETRLREDYLRILRFFRFNAWYSADAPDAAGLAACARLRDGLAGISAERIWAETRRLLGAVRPMRALRAMDGAGVLRRLFPEAEGLERLERLTALELVQGWPVDPMVRFAALFARDPEIMAGLARRLRMSGAERDRLVFAARDQTDLSQAMSPRAIRRALYLAGLQVVLDRVMLATADDDHAGGWEAWLREARDWSRPAMPVSGDDLMAAGLTGGPEMGAALRRLEAAWIESDFQLGRGALLALTRA